MNLLQSESWRVGAATLGLALLGAPAGSVIAMLVVAGWSNREVADRLFVSVRTVEGHLYRIFAKLGIDDRDQLIHLVRLAWHET